MEYTTGRTGLESRHTAPGARASRPRGRGRAGRRARAPARGARHRSTCCDRDRQIFHFLQLSPLRPLFILCFFLAVAHRTVTHRRAPPSAILFRDAHRVPRTACVWSSAGSAPHGARNAAAPCTQRRPRPTQLPSHLSSITANPESTLRSHSGRTCADAPRYDDAAPCVSCVSALSTSPSPLLQRHPACSSSSLPRARLSHPSSGCLRAAR